MAEVLVMPIRIERVGHGQYLLDVTIGSESTQRIACTVLETSVMVVQYDPDPFPRLAADPRPLTEAVVAFHRACGAGPGKP